MAAQAKSGGFSPCKRGVGRKNDLFVFDEKTGQMATVLMSLVESCTANGIDPTVYLNDVLQEMRINPTVDVVTVTPWAWQQRQEEEQVRRHKRARTEAILTAIAAAVANS